MRIRVCYGTTPSKYAPPSSCPYYDVDVTGRSTFTATGLQPNTNYWALLVTIGPADVCQDVPYWDGSVVFTTLGLNQPPTCDLSALPDTLTYDGHAAYDLTTGLVTTTNPTTTTATIATSDPNGDPVTVTSVTADKPACLSVTHTNTTVHLTPQGALTGSPNPPLDIANTCQVQLTATVDDGNGGTNTCTKTLTVTYPQPRLAHLLLADQSPTLNPPGPDASPANPLQDLQFTAIGGWHPDPFTTTAAQLQDPTQPTRTLLPPDQRFTLTGYTHSDHNPLRLRFSLDDPNGTASFDTTTWQIRLEDITGYGHPILLRASGTTPAYNPATRLLRVIPTYGYREDGAALDYTTTDLTPCVQDPTARLCLRGWVYRHAGNPAL